MNYSGLLSVNRQKSYCSSQCPRQKPIWLHHHSTCCKLNKAVLPLLPQPLNCLGCHLPNSTSFAYIHSHSVISLDLQNPLSFTSPPYHSYSVISRNLKNAISNPPNPSYPVISPALQNPHPSCHKTILYLLSPQHGRIHCHIHLATQTTLHLSSPVRKNPLFYPPGYPNALSLSSYAARPHCGSEQPRIGK